MNTDAHDVVRKQCLSARSLDLLLYFIQNRDSDLGDFGRVAHDLRHRAERRFEDCSSQPLNDLCNPHADLSSVSK